MHTIDTNVYIKGATQWGGVAFNSYFSKGGKHIGLNSSGVYEVCCGDDDNGTDIDAHFAPIQTDFGSDRPKRMRWVTIGFESASDLQLTLSVDTQTARTYTVPANVSGNQKTRVTIGRDAGQKGVWWYFRLSNVDGNYFAVNFIKASIQILSGGFK